MSENMSSPEQGMPKGEQLETSEGQRYKIEKDRWKEALGVEVDVPPLPDYVTPDVERKLKDLGFEVIYMPGLDIGDINYLKAVGAENYLDELQKKYPKWRTLESISDNDMKDPAIAHNLDLWYWQETQKGNIDFPKLPGQWMAIEAVEKSEFQNVPDEILRPEKYPFDPNKVLDFLRKTGYRDTNFYPGYSRRNSAWYAVEKILEKSKDKTLNKELGLSDTPADLRLLEAIEWNLAENRFGWNRTHSSEMTKTEIRVPGFNEGTIDSRYITVGDPERTFTTAFGHSGYANHINPSNGVGDVGWRAAITLPK